MGGWRISLEEQWSYKGKTGGEALFDSMIIDTENVLGDFGPVFRLIADDIFEPDTLRRFAEEGADIGGWQELAESTLKAREGRKGRKGTAMGGLIAALGFGMPILVESGALMESFQAGMTDHVERIEKKQMEWGSANPIALFHQTGTGKGFAKTRVETGPGTGRGMAMRKMITITEEEREVIRQKLVGHLSLELTRAGARIARRTMGPGEAAGLSATELRGIGEDAMSGGPGADLISGM
jgi:hypothetical protein